MDLTHYRSKLVGSDDERAVSPVIGVILMVAITVILAAVIAAFVLDLGGSVSEEAQAGVSIEEDEEANEVTVEVTSLGNSDHVNLSGYISQSNVDGWSSPSDRPVDGVHNLQVGDSVTISDDSSADVTLSGSGNSGTITAIAVIEEDGTETQVASEEFDFS